ncbi:MAG: TetR family transcriptional regulator [Acidimicrobiia bacterium]|nr:TetR family transcriptional regulator [Acidimicrobiia bacterium]
MTDTARRPRRRASSDADKEERRRQLLAAAKTVFARKGFHAATIADVAREAKLSYGSVYWYFDSKDDLIHALIESEQEALRHSVEAAMRSAASDDPLAAVRAAIRATFVFFESDSRATKLLFRDALALGGAVEKHVHGIYERFIVDVERAIVAGQRAGVLADAPAHLAAYSVAALIGQLAQRRSQTDDGIDAEAMADFVVWFLMDGLRKRDPS